MAFTVKEWIQKSTEIAIRGVDPNTAPALDAEGLAEPLLDQVIADLVDEYVALGKTRLLPRQTKTLNFVNGTVSLTSDVVESGLDDSVLYDPTDKRKLYAYLGEWNDFTGAYDKRLGYYTVRVYGTMHIIEPGALYDPASGPSVTRTLSAPCFWAVPADVDTDMGVPDEVTTDLIGKLATALQGAMSTKATAK